MNMDKFWATQWERLDAALGDTPHVNTPAEKKEDAQMNADVMKVLMDTDTYMQGTVAGAQLLVVMRMAWMLGANYGQEAVADIVKKLAEVDG